MINRHLIGTVICNLPVLGHVILFLHLISSAHQISEIDIGSFLKVSEFENETCSSPRADYEYEQLTI